MESRSSYKKTSGVSAIRKPKTDLLRRKTLGRNLRPSIDRRISSRDIPPLTPLHRLKRFKAIRDKNLYKNRTSTQKKSIIEMEGITTSVEVHAPKTVEQDNPGAHVFKGSIQESDDVCTQEKNGNSKEIINGNDKEGIVNGKDEEIPTKEGNVLNGHNTQNDENIANDDESAASNSDQESRDNNISEKFSPNVVSSTEDISTLDNVETNSGLAEENFDDAEENLKPRELEEPSDNCETQEHLEKEGSIESDAGSVSSSSTFPPNQFLTSSSEDVSEAAGKKEENSEEEEIDVDQISTKSDDNMKEIEKQEDLKPTKANEIKPSEIPSKIPRSVISSASSYKTAYGSTGRISGRRGVGGVHRTGSLKRKAEDEIEPPCSGKRLSSPSQPSPRWKFFRPSISSLWSPRKTLYDFSITSTPLKNVDDSMAVNIDEESINCHLNDSDLFLDSNKSSLTNKRSRWGCNVM